MSTRRSEYMHYPQYDDLRVGCKVSWHYYRDEKKAKKAAAAAEHNAKLLEAQGYDWGYQVPGSIRRMSGYEGEWSRYNDLFEVCIP